MTEEKQEDLLAYTADIVAAHVSNNNVAMADLPELIARVHGALAALGTPVEAPVEKQEPAVSIRTSVKPDYIVCLEDGKKLKMLRRYLMTNYGMTPDDYRAKWGLPKDYPMVAPNYAETRRALAKEIGLGSKGRGGGRKPAAAKAAAAPARRGRPKTAA
ncbi:transcriptional regulator, MucR family [Sphingopyxis sp. YR583]|uniref:MucR family transcriptional regulator n=1 Tax=Sphingopyxis sp. YR583 TaxID=1881047 RepID=UPI0008A77B23|nr:MucR family transcriptional regulator [Sphingopyxis sp. YR583]SEH14886.1 transcriptional regulator, MucR family [Sphingopyxis sp. YR583]